MAENHSAPYFSDAPEMNKTITYLLEVETLAQDILTDRKVQVQLADKHNKLREAFRAVQQSDCKTVPLKFANIYMDLSKKTCISTLQKELNDVGVEVEEKRAEIKGMLQKMRDLEHLPGIVGFSLKPLTGAEAKAICRKSGF